MKYKSKTSFDPMKYTKDSSLSEAIAESKGQYNSPSSTGVSISERNGEV